MGLIVLLFSSSEWLLQMMSSILYVSHSHGKTVYIDVHIFLTKHRIMPDEARRCSYDPLFMLVMFCCLTLLSGSSAAL